MTSKIEMALHEELARLVDKYGFGRELSIIWLPATEGIATMFGEKKELSGEVIGTKIIIYEHQLARALKTCDHEFFEYILHKNLVRPYSNLLEGMEKAVQKTIYENKEAFIEVLTNMEIEERRRLSKEKKL